MIEIINDKNVVTDETRRIHREEERKRREALRKMVRKEREERELLLRKMVDEQRDPLFILELARALNCEDFLIDLVKCEIDDA